MSVRTIKDIARLAGVSVGSASMVLSDKWHKKVKPEIAERIKALAEEHNFQPNLIARGFKTRRSYRVGIVIEGNIASRPIIGSFSHHEFISDITENFGKHGYATEIIQIDDDEKSKIFANKRLQTTCDALIFLDWDNDSVRSVIEVADIERPFILISATKPDFEVPCLYKDMKNQVSEAVSLLISKKHKRIAYICAVDSAERRSEKLSGYKDALMSNNITIGAFLQLKSCSHRKIPLQLCFVLIILIVLELCGTWIKLE
ncbi:MAG: LacI family DNA-binding transcriptional regulator [Planctomycetota bacterium]|jgi:DNA-binding LacI/PurR family transcriptional regulator